MQLPNDTTAWLVHELALRTGTRANDIRFDEPLSSLGLDSAYATELSGRLAERVGRDISPTIFFENATLDEVIVALSTERPVSVAATASITGKEVAIVGIACRFPGANSPDKFWSNLVQAVDPIKAWPEDRWFGASSVPDYVPRYGGFIEGLADFEPGAFGINDLEARYMDPQQRLLLMLATEVFEDAGIKPALLAGSRTGVYIGISASEYGAHLMNAQTALNAYAGTGNALSVAANRLSYAFGLNGPSMAIDTACSSSLVACHLAMQSLRQGETEVALVGGVNALLSPAISIGFAQAGMLARDGRCKTFADGADGYVRSEGCGLILLKTVEAATRDGNPIYAILKGSAVNQDGASSGLTAPNRRAQISVLRDACRDANVRPADIDYVEAHGTGTHLGDPIEAGSIGAVYGANRAAPVPVGSVKSNIGHLESAAGIAGLIKVAMMLRHRQIPPNLHCNVANSLIDFATLGLRVANSHEEFVGRESLSAGVSSFGFGGTNAHVILGEAPKGCAATGEEVDATIDRMVLFSARSFNQLKTHVSECAGWLADHPDVSIRDVAETTARRTNQAFRKGFLATSIATLTEQIDAWLANCTETGSSSETSFVFVFPGQGVQWVDFVAAQYEESRRFRSLIHRCDEVLESKEQTWSLGEIARREIEPVLSVQSQILAFVGQIGITEALGVHGVKPHCVVGHSLGEIAAAYCCGALTLLECLTLILVRGTILESQAYHGQTLALAIGEDDLEQIVECSDDIKVAASNAPGQVSVSVLGESSKSFINLLRSRKIAYSVISDKIAFHSGISESDQERMSISLGELSPQKSEIEFLSTVSGDFIKSELLHADYWVKNLSETVHFRRAIELYLSRDTRKVAMIEVAPRPILAPTIRRIARSIGSNAPELINLPALNSPRAGIRHVALTLYDHGADIRDIDGSAAGVVNLPVRPWETSRYWLDVAAPSDVSNARSGFVDTTIGFAVRELSVGGNDGPEFSQHLVAERSVIPAAYQLQLLSDAVADMMPGHKIDLIDCSFLRPIDVTEGLVRLRVVVHADRETAGRVWLSFTPNNEEFSLATTAGWEIPADEDTSNSVPSSQSVDGDGAEIKMESIYASLAATGLHYGPAFRRIKSARLSGSCVEMELLPADGQTSLFEAATLMDAALHPLAALPHVASTASLVIPKGVSRLRSGASIERARFARLSSDPRPNGELIADVTYYDENKALIAEIRGLSFSKAARWLPIEKTLKNMSCYESFWIDSPKEPANTAIRDILIVSNDLELATAVAAEIQEAGVHTFVIYSSDQESVEDDVVTVIAGDRESYSRGLEKIISISVAGIDAIISLSGLADAPASQVAADASALIWGASYSGLSRPRVIFLTAGVSSNGSVFTPKISALLNGFARCIPFENPLIRARCVDLADSNADTIATNALAEVALHDDEMEVSRTHAVRRVKRLRRLRRLQRGAGFQVQPEAAYLVTGGGGALGCSVAAWLVGAGAKKVICIGRRDVPPKQFNDLAIRCGGTEARLEYRSIDTSDASQLRTLRADLIAAGYPIRGIVHAAGTLSDGALLDLDAESIRTVFSPKVDGLAALDEVFSHDALDMFVQFSSAVSVIGSPGQSAYCGANAVLDAYAIATNSAGRRTLSISWGPWAEAGMATREGVSIDELAEGLDFIDHDTGIRALELALQSDASHLVVVPFEIENLIQFYPEGNGFSLFEGLFERDQKVLRSAGTSSDISSRRVASVAFADAESETERLIQSMWQRMLSVDAVGVHDSFFELGGDSVMGNQIMIDIGQRFGIRLSAEEAFADFTVRALASAVEEKLLERIDTMSDEEIQGRLNV